MLNGIFYVTGTRQGGTSRQVYRLLNSILRDDGVHYDNEEDRLLFGVVMSGLKELTGLEFRSKTRAKVGQALRDIEEFGFEKRVAICDIHNGAHSILLTRKENKNDDVWFSAFDPYWYGDGRRDCEDLKYLEDKPDMNVKIREEHLLAKKLGTAAAIKKGKHIRWAGFLLNDFLPSLKIRKRSNDESARAASNNSGNTVLKRCWKSPAIVAEAGVHGDREGPLFRSLERDGLLSDRRFNRHSAWEMLAMRTRAAGITTPVCNHSFRAVNRR